MAEEGKATIRYEVEGDREAIEAARKIATAHHKMSMDVLWEQRRGMMTMRSYMWLMSDAMRLTARFDKENKGLAAALQIFGDAMAVVNLATFAYTVHLRRQELAHYKAMRAIQAQAVATKGLAAANVQAAATGRLAAGVPGVGGVAGRGVGSGTVPMGGGLMGRMGGLLGRIPGGGMAIGGGILAGALGAEFIAPALALAARGKNPFGSDYKTFSQIMADQSKQMPLARAHGGTAFQQFNEFNGPVTSDSIRQLDDANKRMLRQFGESP